MRVRLVRKLANLLDGVDVSAHRSGDILELPRHDAELLIAERWAVPEAAAVAAAPERDEQYGRIELGHERRDTNSERQGTPRGERDR